MTHAGLGTKYRYRVKQGNRILDNRGPTVITYKPGDYLPDDYPKKNLEGLLRAGKVKTEDMTMHPDYVPDVPVDTVPGAETHAIGVTDGETAIDVSKAGSNTIVGTGRKQPSRPTLSVRAPNGPVTESFVRKPVAVPNPLGKPVTQEHSPWTLDPASLQGKDLDQLNVMILERDPSCRACSSIEEAIALLSLDFKGMPAPTGVVVDSPETRTANDPNSNAQVATQT